MAFEELIEGLQAGELDEDAFVWQAGMDEWVRVRRHPDIATSILTPPPLPGVAKKVPHPVKRLGASMLEIFRGMRSQ